MSFVFCLLTLASCTKRNVSVLESEQKIAPPLLRIDNLFPKGVLQFNSKESAVFFYKQLQADPQYKKQLPISFISIGSYFTKYKEQNTDFFVRTSNSNNAVLVDTAEYLYDMRNSLVTDEAQAEMLNEDLQIIVGGHLFELTRIGTFKVSSEVINQFVEFLTLNESEIFYNPAYTSVPNEIPLGNNEFEIFSGANRVQNIADLLQPADDGGFGGGGTGWTPPNNPSLPSNFQYATYTVGSSFNLSHSIYFDGDRRFQFETFINDFLGLGLINTVGVRAKVQKERKFLWFNYWSESYADEIIVGCDNMDLLTDYTFPTPQIYNTLAYPVFAGTTDFQLGNNLLEVMNINVNLSALGQTLNNTSFNNFVNSQLNSFLNNQYNNYFTTISNDLITLIDPSFVNTYANYTKKVNSIRELNKYRFTIGKGEKIQGYSHVNVWRFDWNIGTPGTTYGYDMKTGSFFGRARIGNKWYGIRIIKQP